MNLTRRATLSSLIFGLTFYAPFTAKPASIAVNGTCEVGCPSTPPLSNGQSTSGSFDFDYTFVDGDIYNVAGTYGASYTTVDGSTIYVDPTITYEGHTPPPSGQTFSTST